MSSLAQKWQNRRASSKGRRDLQRAINEAGSPTMRAELLAIAARNSGLLR